MTYETDETIIWVLGARSSNADRNILWFEDCPNLANSDILFVNLDSLRLKTDEWTIMDFTEARQYMFHHIMAGEKQLFFILPAQVDDIILDNIMPVSPICKSVRRCKYETFDWTDSDDIIADAFYDYLKNTKDCNYYIDSFDYDYFWSHINPNSEHRETYDYTQRIDNIGIVNFCEILNKAKQKIGVSFRILIRDSTNTCLHSTSSIHILPPPTEISVEEGIDIFCNHLMGRELKESSPKWESEINIPGLNEINRNITQININIKDLIDHRKTLELEKNRLEKFRRLLWSKGEKILQEIVKDAFIVLGFTEIRQERAKNLEDWLFDFKLKPLIGVVEVTGADKRTSLKALRKCADWVTDYDEIGKDCKGIFIPNQYRLEEYPKSKKKREHFESNEIRFAKKHNICILPSHLLFESVVEKLQDNSKFSRNYIEEKILSADPICIFD